MTSLQETVDKMGLTVRSEFVPFSRSRRKDEDPKRNIDKRSLNWTVTVARNGRDILTTEYSAGVGHCPSYKQGARWTLGYAALIEYETENGFAAKAQSWGITKGKAIEPKALDVLYSLVMDSSVLDESSFEDWASSLGYDTDSRNAETIYRACLEIALKLRAGLGDAAMTELREAFQDY
jgi:hypothetical protein